MQLPLESLSQLSGLQAGGITPAMPGKDGKDVPSDDGTQATSFSTLLGQCVKDLKSILKGGGEASAETTPASNANNTSDEAPVSEEPSNLDAALCQASVICPLPVQQQPPQAAIQAISIPPQTDAAADTPVKTEAELPGSSPAFTQPAIAQQALALNAPEAANSLPDKPASADTSHAQQVTPPDTTTQQTPVVAENPKPAAEANKPSTVEGSQPEKNTTEQEPKPLKAAQEPTTPVNTAPQTEIPLALWAASFTTMQPAKQSTPVNLQPADTLAVTAKPTHEALTSGTSAAPRLDPAPLIPLKMATIPGNTPVSPVSFLPVGLPAEELPPATASLNLDVQGSSDGIAQNLAETRPALQSSGEPAVQVPVQAGSVPLGLSEPATKALEATTPSTQAGNLNPSSFTQALNALQPPDKTKDNRLPEAVEAPATVGNAESSTGLSSAVAMEISSPASPAVSSSPPPKIESSNSDFLFRPSADAVTDQVVEGASYGLKAGRTEITIKLNPDNLGEVRVNLSSNAQQQVTAKLIASSPETRELLQSQMDSLRQSLESQGVRVEHLSVVMAGSSSDTRDAGQRGNSEHQAPFQQNNNQSQTQSNSDFNQNRPFNPSAQDWQNQAGQPKNPYFASRPADITAENSAPENHTAPTQQPAEAASHDQGRVSVLA